MAGTGEGAGKIAAAAVALALVAAFGVRAVRAPFGNTALTSCLGVYSELFAESWDEFGFARSWGVPMAGCVGATVEDRIPYAHQAPIGWWFPYFGRALLGKGHLGFKLFPVLFACVAALVVFAWILRRYGATWSLLWLAAFLALPVVQLYAGLPGIESVSFLFAALFVVAWESWRERGGRARHFAALAIFLAGTQTAWSFYFCAPGVLAAELCRPATERRLRASIPLFALGVLGFGIVFLHLLIGTGSVAAVVGDVTGTAGEVFTGGLSEQTLLGEKIHFFPAQTKLFLENLGKLAGPAMLLAAAWVLARRTLRIDALTRFGVPFLVQGLLTVVLFNSRSNTHGYYGFLLAPGCAIFLVQGARALARPLVARCGVLAPVPAAGLLALVLSAGLARNHELEAGFEMPGLEALAAGVDAMVPPEGWVCSMDVRVIEASLYSQRRWTPPLLTPDQLESVLRARDERAIPMRRLYVYAGPEYRVSAALAPLWFRVEELVAAGRGVKTELPGNATLYIL